MTYTKNHVAPCFPPHYKIYENVKETYIKIIYDLILENHIPNLETYMKDVVAGTDGDNSGILIDMYKFIETLMNEINEEPSHPMLEDLYYRLSEYYAIYIDLSEVTMKERFGRIIDEQRH